ncbi:Histidine biosynthesis [Parasponia andersonii]|uniref:Histidine biosynthesis n=1 Tax=Parasponia andersonii TaxID=3476 RepID=A0A2P5B0W0_PARAD|nr:Histidine biosynthesis [Parasponia andersonii]
MGTLDYSHTRTQPLVLASSGCTYRLSFILKDPSDGYVHFMVHMSGGYEKLRFCFACDEPLVNYYDNLPARREIKRKLGIDEELVALLGKHSPIPVTYAGGVSVMTDLETIREAGKGRVDVTVGSALDIFGGNLAYTDVVEWHAKQQTLTV